MHSEASAAGPIVLCINSGSSSLKFALYRVCGKQEDRLVSGAAEKIGQRDGHLWIRAKDDAVITNIHAQFTGHSAAAERISLAARELGFPRPAAAGHRIVHGGPNHFGPMPVQPDLLVELRKLIPFAPLHLPSAIEAIEAVAERFPGLPQVVCFDTAFHRRMPDVAQRFPISRDLWGEGVRRYGFHGLSFEYILSALGAAVQGRLIIAHLGNGASLAAVLDGQPVDTTMGFTPAGGLMMGTRSGDLDPGLLIHLMKEKRHDANEIDELVNNRSGLLGVSGTTADMKTLLERRKHDPYAAQAVELFCYCLRKHIGALAAVLGGLDTLVFTGGIGERSPAVRWETCQNLGHLGIALDPNRNIESVGTISVPASSCTVRVIPTNEDLMIARHTRALLKWGER